MKMCGSLLCHATMCSSLLCHVKMCGYPFFLAQNVLPDRLRIRRQLP